ncbi:MAG: hypothetical protein MN733_42100 [Nitrososphaera sp.]|nr:hypothetical protein [Nitrososphaera sp.]
MTFQDSISRAAKEKAEEEANRVRNLLVDVQTKVFDRAAAYTNLIMLGGYAGAFAIWNFTREHLTEWAEIWAALLLTISLVTFIFFEVFKMVFSSRITLKQRALLTKALPPDQFVKELQELGLQDSVRTNRWVIPLWIGSLAIAVPTALGAVGIFIWSFVTILLSGQR